MNREQKELIAVATVAAEKAYAPYSKFRVGAAILTDKGTYIGANIENASTNIGICAERVAISHARMNDATNIIGIAVSCIDAQTASLDVSSTMPCGACRQWIAELAPEAWLVTNGSDRVFTLQDILPNPSYLIVKSRL